MSLAHLSLFAGYGGADLALDAVFDTTTVAYSEIEAGPAAIMARRFPHAAALGDITTLDTAGLPPIDVISGGSPCTDLSTAGRRSGMSDGTRSNLWVAMRSVIAVVRPPLVIWENVRGAYSTHASSAVARCSGCQAESGTPLRALGRVLGDLSDLGYDANWYGVRASDVGLAHQRFRVFVCAWRRDVDIRAWLEAAVRADAAPLAAAMPSGTMTLFPTPNAADAWVPGTVSENTLRRGDPNGTLRSSTGSLPKDLTLFADRPQRWDAAVVRATAVVGRSAPPAVMDGRLHPAFSEWLMGLPAGWVTDLDLTRAQMLRAIGNGIAPAQLELALRLFVAEKGIL